MKMEEKSKRKKKDSLKKAFITKVEDKAKLSNEKI